MGLFSKIAGGFLGFSFGGPLGAVIGVALAGFFTDSVGLTQRPLDAKQQSQAIFFAATFSLLGKLAKVDGHVSREEIKVVDEFIEKQLNLDNQTADMARRIFNEAKLSPHNYQEFAAQFRDCFYDQPQMKQIMTDLLLRVAAADGKFTSEEESFINEVAQIFNIPPSIYDHLKKQYQLTSGRHYAILGLDPDASVEEIKKNYKRLVLENHPDRVLSQGMPEDFKKAAESKFNEIKQAYDLIKKERDF